MILIKRKQYPRRYCNSRSDYRKERKAVEYGTVLQVGPTAYTDYGRDPSIIKVGDKVSFNRYSGKEITDLDEKNI